MPALSIDKRRRIFYRNIPSTIPVFYPLPVNFFDFEVPILFASLRCLVYYSIRSFR